MSSVQRPEGRRAKRVAAQARDKYALAEKALASAPHGKGTEADLASLKSGVTGLDVSVQDMQRAFDAGDYVAAKTKAQAAIDAAPRPTSPNRNPGLLTGTRC